MLTEQQDALKAKGINLVAIQAVASTPEVVEEWKESNPGLFPIGRLNEKGSKPGWIAGIESFPWLIPTDSQGKVAAEGFAIEVLKPKLRSCLSKSALRDCFPCCRLEFLFYEIVATETGSFLHP